MAVGSEFDGLFDTVLATSSNTGHVCSINMFDRFWSTNILRLTRAIVNCAAFFSIGIPKKYFVSLAESKMSLSRCDSNPNS